MPHQSIILVPGVVENETQAMNQAGVSISQLIRYTYDPKYGGLIQKLGGWQKFYPYTFPAVVRALCAWQDLNAVTHLAVGSATGSSGSAQMTVVSSGSAISITPQTVSDSIAPVASTTSGSNVVTITDSVTTGITSYDSVFIQTHLSIGGLVLYGMYQCTFVSSTQYSVVAQDILGNLVYAISTSTSPTVASFTTVSGQAFVSVTLANHGYAVGSTYPVLIPTSVGGITVYGNYIVQTVSSTSVFTILASATATSSATASINGGDVAFSYAFGYGSPALGEGWGVGGYGTQGWGGGGAVTPSTGTPIAASDWSTANYGDILVMSPVNGTYGSSIPVTFTNGSSAITGANLPIAYGTPVTFATTGSLPTGFTAGTTYYVLNGNSSVSMKVSATVGGSAISASSAGSGTQTMSVPSQVGPNLNFQPLYVWDPLGGSSSAVAIAAPQAPNINDGFFIAMPQRQIIVWGSTVTGIQDPLLLRWCDVNNYSAWVDLVTNQAGQFRLSTGSRIVGCIQGGQLGYVWTDIGLWTMQYVGLPNVYSINEEGVGCGLIGRKACGVLNGVVYWMGPQQFYAYAGGEIQSIPCPVWDIAFQELDTVNVQRIRCAVNSRFNEVAWYVPIAGGSGENTVYVKYNVGLNAWDYGTLGRSAWIDQNVLGAPIGADPSTLYVYQHETSNDADGSAMVSYFTTGYAVLNDGDEQMFVDEVWPDMKWGLYGGSQNANVSITFNMTNFPGTTPITQGPYVVQQSTQIFNPRIRTRLLSVTIGSSDLGSFWRIGQIRYRGQIDGRYGGA